MKTLLIDDMRNILADRVCRTFEEGLEAIKEGGWGILYLDHDLGDAQDRSGYDIIRYIEENQELRPDVVIIVSSNPVGVKNIQAALKSMNYFSHMRGNVVRWVLQKDGIKYG